MKSARKNTDLLDEGCQYIEDLMLEDILSRGSLTTILLNEVFTKNDFDNLIATIEKQIKLLPERMSNTRESLKQAVEEAEESVKAMDDSRTDNEEDASRQSKEVFARVTAKIASMGTTLQSVIKGLKKIEGLQALMFGVEADEDLLLTAALDSKGQNGKATIKKIEQLVRTNFKPQGFLDRLFGGGGEAEYFGLTSELFINDIAALRMSDLSALLNGTPLAPEEFISKDDAATLVDESGLETEEETSGDEAPVADEKEAEKEQADAEADLKAAVEAEAGESQSPKDAAFGALDAWTSGLSATSQKSLTAKNRIGDLKDVIGMALDDSAKAIEGEVSAAIQLWRDKHEKDLMKSKRFAKKNFDALQQLIPNLASAMLKKSNESKLQLTKGNVRKIVFEFLNKKFYKNSDNVLSERLVNSDPRTGAHFEGTLRSESDVVRYRWLKMAGLENLSRLKHDLDNVTVESKKEDGELILEKWRRMAGITRELK